MEQKHVEVEQTEISVDNALGGGVPEEPAQVQVVVVPEGEKEFPVPAGAAVVTQVVAKKQTRGQRRAAARAAKQAPSASVPGPKPKPAPKGAGKPKGKPGPKGAPKNAPKPAPVASAPPAPFTPPPPPAPVYGRWSENARAYRPTVQSEDVHKRLAKAGIHSDVAAVLSTTDTPHPVSAAVRSVATVSALDRLYRAGCRRVCSLYGSRRDASLLRRLNFNVAPQNRMHLTIHRPVATNGDLNRQIEDLADLPAEVDVVDTLPNPSDHDGFLLVDVYEVTNTRGDPVEFTPAWVLPYAVAGPVFWVGHDLRGACGTVENEGAWIQVVYENELRVLHKPDKVSAPYPLHRSCSWLMSPGKVHDVRGVVGWTESQRISDTVLVRFGQLHGSVVPTPVVPDRPAYAWVDLPIIESRLSWALPYVPSWIISRLPSRKGLVNLEMVQYLEDNYLSKQFSAYTWRSCLSYATNLLEKREHHLLRQFFREETRTLAEDSALYAVFSHVSSRRETAETLVSTHGTDMYSYNVAVTSIGSPGRPKSFGWLRWFLYAIGGVALAYWLWRRSRRFSYAEGNLVAVTKQGMLGLSESVHETWSSLSAKVRAKCSDLWARILALQVDPQKALEDRTFSTLVCFVGAGFEETVKRIHPALAGALMFWEFGLKVVLASQGKVRMPNGTPVPMRWALLDAALAIGMHAATLSMPFLPAVAVHAGWNAVLISLGRTYATGSLLTAFGLWKLTEPVETDPVFLRWKHHHYVQPWELRGRWDTILEGGFRFRLEEGFVPRQHETFFEEKVLDETLEVANTIVPVAPSRISTIFIFLPCLPLYAPQRCDQVLLDVIRARLLVAPPLSPKLQWAAWIEESATGHGVPFTIRSTTDFSGWKKSKAYGPGQVPLDLPDGLFTEMLMEDWEFYVLAWYDNIIEPHKKARALAAIQLYRQAPPSEARDRAFSIVEVMLKTDEILLKNGGFKPRPVLPVDPLIQVMCGPYVMEATRRLKLVWDGKRDLGADLSVGQFDSRYVEIRTSRLTVKFGSGMTDRDLNVWVELALRDPPLGSQLPCVDIIVAGDDSLVLLRLWDGDGWELFVLEGDFSMYDQSQSRGPLEHQLCFSRRLGMPVQICRILHNLTYTDYQAQGTDGVSKIKIKHQERPMRATGGADTTFGNTTCSGHGWAYVMWAVAGCTYQTLGSRESAKHALTRYIEEEFALLGFSLKLKVHDRVEDATFLKGMWYPHRSGQLFWGILPSRFCKLGKSLRDPRHLYRDGRGRRVNLELASERFAHDLALGLRPSVPVPLVAEFVKRYALPPYHQAVSLTRRVEVEAPEPWKVTFTGQAALGADPTTPSEGYDWSGLYSRYQLDPSDFATMGSLVAASAVGTLLQHPGFERLALVDYN